MMVSEDRRLVKRAYSLAVFESKATNKKEQDKNSGLHAKETE